MTPARRAELLNTDQYPQFTRNESLVARAWLLKHADEWDDVRFNVNVGSLPSLPPGTSDAIIRQAAAVSSKRIDMVAVADEFALLIECKVRLSLTALGQLLGYEILWRVEHPETTDIELLAIGHSALVDAADILLAHGVQVELFPDVTLVLPPAA